MAPHQPVLLRECLKLFEESDLKVFVDGTLGAGGHAEALLKEHPEIVQYIGIDQDQSALAIAEERLAPWKEKLTLVHGNFSGLEKYLKQNVDGILLDLGVSSMQLDKVERGFSFRGDAPLDMRMDRTRDLTAATILNEWPEQEIARLFRDYGEVKPWRKCAALVVEARPYRTTEDLVRVLEPFLMRFKKPGLHPLTLVFQGLRIAVNSELDVLRETLPVAIDKLNPGGVIGVISFHSLEDRIVKNTLRFAASDKYDTSGVGGVFHDKEPLVDIITRKPITATEDEMEENPRSRSAKLRGARKR